MALSHYELSHDQFLTEVRRCRLTLRVYCACFRRLKVNMMNRCQTVLSIYNVRPYIETAELCERFASDPSVVGRCRLTQV